MCFRLAFAAQSLVSVLRCVSFYVYVSIWNVIFPIAHIHTMHSIHGIASIAAQLLGPFIIRHSSSSSLAIDVCVADVVIVSRVSFSFLVSVCAVCCPMCHSQMDYTQTKCIQHFIERQSKSLHLSSVSYLLSASGLRFNIEMTAQCTTTRKSVSTSCDV